MPLAGTACYGGRAGQAEGDVDWSLGIRAEEVRGEWAVGSGEEEEGEEGTGHWALGNSAEGCSVVVIEGLCGEAPLSSVTFGVVGRLGEGEGGGAVGWGAGKSGRRV